MTLTLVEVAGANFRTDQKSDELNTEFMRRLRKNKRFLPARLAIARSLSVSTKAPPIQSEGQNGKVIKGDTLFGIGADQLTWLTLILEHSGEPNMDLKRLVGLVGAHWKRGLNSLDRDWKLANGDSMKFIMRLAESADLSTTNDELQLSESTIAEEDPNTIFEISVRLGEVGHEVSTNENVLWCVNGKGTSPHSAVMGQSGTGKTVMAAAMLRSIREQVQVPLIAFDFKGDLMGFTGIKKGQDSLGRAFEADSINPPREPIPLDVLHVAQRDEYGIDQAASRFRDLFARLKGSQIGAIQQGRILQAASRALSTERPCELKHVFDHLTNIYDEEGAKADGAVSKMNDLCRLPLFKPDLLPEEFFQRSWVVDLSGGISEDIRVIVINLILDALDQYLSNRADAPTGADGSRALRVICMIDEAHQILGKKLPSLSRLVRMSRSKGGAVMLVSQSPDDFSGEEDEFLDNMGLVAAFSTNAKPKAAQRVLGTGAKLTSLKKGECYARVDGTTRRVKAWEES